MSLLAATTAFVTTGFLPTSWLLWPVESDPKYADLAAYLSLWFCSIVYSLLSYLGVSSLCDAKKMARSRLAWMEVKVKGEGSCIAMLRKWSQVWQKYGGWTGQW